MAFRVFLAYVFHGLGCNRQGWNENVSLHIWIPVPGKPFEQCHEHSVCMFISILFGLVVPAHVQAPVGCEP